MRTMRLMGSMVKKLATDKNIDYRTLAERIDCPFDRFQYFLDGRLFLAFEQLELLAKIFNISVDNLMAGDREYYEQNVVHCMGEFDDSENREIILDIIDDYILLRESIPQS